jgi:organic hydroperoxide reductase OsmC/OhrA
MHNLPHHYGVAAVVLADGNVTLTSNGLSSISSAPPIEFGGPGDVWSPETLLVAAVADCFVLTFRGLARASKLSWISLRCEVDGTLDRVERVLQFTEFHVRASLRVPADVRENDARLIMERAEQSCLIRNSLKGNSHLEADVVIE